MSDKIEKVHKRLTLAELKHCKGFENYSDEQAEETIKSLEKLSILFYELYMKQKINKDRMNKKMQEDNIENSVVAVVVFDNKEHQKGKLYERKSKHKKRRAA
jgi:hypothetical protein